MGLKTAVFLTFCLFLCGCGASKPAPIYDLKLAGRSSGTATVVPGDSISTIAQRYNLTIEDIIRMNMLSGDVIQPGQRLTLPPPHSYIAKKGDSVASIAGTFDVSAYDLAAKNKLPPPYVLHVGQTLILPAQRSGTVMNEPADIAMPVGNGMFLTPVKGRILSAYGPKEGGLYNDGINIAAEAGSTVHAADAGTVVYAGNGLDGYGNLVLIRHDNGFFTVYSHLAQTQIAKGATVKRGATIGQVGASGRVAEPQLHFEIRKGTKSLNPQKYL